MSNSRWHPDVEDIVIVHDQVSIVSKVRKAGFRRSESWGISKLKEVIGEAKKEEELYRAAAVYLKLIILDQPFSDGNHRTAYLVTNQMISKNGEDFKPEKELGQQEIVDYLKSEVKFNSTSQNAKWLKGDIYE